MPRTQSAKKALRQNIVRRARNIVKKEAYKNAVKLVRKLISAKKMDDAKTALAKAFKALDKAAKTDVITKNKANRLKSRLSKLLGKK